jgi:hypothetical protein
LRGGGAGAGARERFVRAAGENGYIVRRLLAERADQNDPELMPALAEVLRRELDAHPSDLESALMLSVLRLRLGDPQAALDAIAKGQTWAPPRWDFLVLKAAALDRLGQKARADQALADLRGVRPDISLTFAGYEPSLFFGPLQRTLDSFFLERVAPARPEPERSFLTWLLLREAGDARAEEAQAAFIARLSEAFAGQEFHKSSAPAGSARSAKYEEYLGEAERILREARPALLGCERARRAARPNPSANLALKIKILGDGTVVGIGIDDESLGDPWVVYCVAGRILELSFPPSPRGTEVLPLPLLFGPEADEEEREKS